MSVQVRVDTSRFNKALKTYIDKTQIDASKVVDKQARLMIVASDTGLVDNTPPNTAQHRGLAAKKAGENKVAGDINKLYISVSAAAKQIEKTDPKKARQFGKLAREGKRSAAMQIYRTSVGARGNPEVGNFDKSLHKQNRRKGEVLVQYPRQIVTDVTALKRYIKDKQRNVGILASGVNSGAEITKSRKMPSWIKRHGSNRSIGRKYGKVNTRSYGYEIGSNVGFQTRETQNRFRYVLRYRENAMLGEMRRILDDNAKKFNRK